MDIQTLIANFLSFVNNTIIPFILAIAFLIFIWNITKYFVFGGSNEESQEKARATALWGISAFVIILSLWGIVNFVVDNLGLDNRGIVPDYMCEKTANGSCRN